MQYRERIMALADSAGLRIHEELYDPYSAHAVIRPADLEVVGVRCAPIVDIVTYWIALHELGHAFAGLTTPRGYFYTSTYGIVDDEARAWIWAIDNAGAPFDNVAKDLMQMAMATYTGEYGDDEFPASYHELMARAAPPSDGYRPSIAWNFVR